MIYLHRKIKNSKRSLKYRVGSGNVEAVREGQYDVIILPIGSRLIKDLKAVHGFVERKQTTIYKAVSSPNKTKAEKREDIIKSAKKVTRSRKKSKTSSKSSSPDKK